MRDEPRNRSLNVVRRINEFPADAEVALIWIACAKREIVAHETRLLATRNLHAGLHRERFIMTLPAVGKYEVEVRLVIRVDVGIIPATYTSSKIRKFGIY